MLLPRARLQQARNGTCGLRRIAILLARAVVVGAGERDDVVEQGLQSATGFEHHLHMIAVRFFEFGAVEQLRHAEQRVQRRAQFVADIGDEHRFRLRTRHRCVARMFGVLLLMAEALDEIVVLLAKLDAFLHQSRDAAAIGGEHRGEQDDENGGHRCVHPVLAQQQEYERRQRETRMRDVGGAVRGAGDELGCRHAEEGEGEIGLRRIGTRHEPEPRAHAPRRAGDGGDESVAVGPVLRVAAEPAAPVGGGQLFRRDDDGDLERERDERKQICVCAEKRHRNAQRGERKREIVAAERVKDIDAAGERSARFLFRTGVDRRHCENPRQSLASRPFRNA